MTLMEYLNNADLAPMLDGFRKPGDFTNYYQRSFGNMSAQAIAAPAKDFPAMVSRLA